MFDQNGEGLELLALMLCWFHDSTTISLHVRSGTVSGRQHDYATKPACHAATMSCSSGLRCLFPVQPSSQPLQSRGGILAPCQRHDDGRGTRLRHSWI